MIGMIKKYRVGIAITLIALFLGVGLCMGLVWGVSTFKFEDAPVTVMGPITTQGIAGTRVPYLTFLEVEDLEASKWVSLVDLSDATNFPHARTNSINLKQIQHSGVLSEATHWDIRFGVVITVGSTHSLVEWIHADHRVRSTQYHWDWDLPEQGLNLSIKDEDELMFVASVAFTSTTQITTSTPLSSPVESVGVVTTPGIGDLIMFMQEIDAGGYISHTSVNVSYDTQ